MSLEGSIKDFGLSDIFQLIHVQQKSGVMSIQDGSRKAGVGFVKGMVVSAQMDETEGMERIGEVLVRAKRISSSQLEKALKVQRETGDYIGQILISNNMVTDEDIKKALRLQTLETVYRLFRWKGGRYTFDQREVDYNKQYIDPISTEHILMEGVRRLDEWPPIEKKIPSLQVVFAQVPEKRAEIEQASVPSAPAKSTEDDPFADLDPEPEGRFSAHEINVYHAVDGSHDVSGLIDVLQIGEFEVCKALANLLNAGLIVPLNVSSTVAEAERPAVLASLTRYLSLTLRWAVNLALIVGMTVPPASFVWKERERIAELVRAEMGPPKVVLLANQVKGLRELVEMWKAENGTFPKSLFDPLTRYGAAAWPLDDPWGRPWAYDANSGSVGLAPDPGGENE
jgi:hypothetical protein